MSKSFSAIIWLLAALAVLVAAGYLLYLLASGAVTVITLPQFDAARAWGLVSACTAVGIVTMVTIQSFRLLIPVRGRFHRRALGGWLAEGQADAAGNENWNELQKRLPIPTSTSSSTPASTESSAAARVERALSEFETPALGTRGKDALALYDLPLEQLCGQLSSAADLLLEKPGRSPHLAVAFAGSEGVELLVKLLKDQAAPASLAATEARAALARIIQQRVDAFHITTGSEWRHRLRSMALIVSMCFAAILAYSALPPESDRGTASVSAYAFYGAVTGFLGAFVAMLLRDLTAIVELRRRRS